MEIKNNHTGPLGFPGGVVLARGQQADVPNWSELKANAVVQAWLKAGVLTEIGSDPEGDDTPDKAELLERAKALGIDAKGTWGIPKLQEAIAAAEAAGEQQEQQEQPEGSDPEGED